MPVRCLDGQADLLLDDDRPDEARNVARHALDRALELNNVVTVVQARTTMAMTCLLDDDAHAAAREINRAIPYRRPGRSLVLLALQALTALKAGSRQDDAKKLFEQLKEEAVQRRTRDQQDFAAWDFEGLAICGTLIVDRRRVVRGRADPVLAVVFSPAARPERP